MYNYNIYKIPYIYKYLYNNKNHISIPKYI